MLFEYGPYIRNEKKTKGDIAVRFKFPYILPSEKADLPPSIRIKVVLVSTFKDRLYNNMTEGDKMILTFKNAGLLAMHTFLKAVDLCYTQSATLLMSPLCGAIFSKESVKHAAMLLKMEEKKVLKIMNASTCNGGQHLADSDSACAIAAMVTATKKSEKSIRESMLSKVVKQYVHAKKPFDDDAYRTYCTVALGGVPENMDSGTLIERYNNIQSVNASRRAAMLLESDSIVMQVTGMDTSVQSTGETSTSEYRPHIPKSPKRPSK